MFIVQSHNKVATFFVAAQDASAVPEFATVGGLP